MMAMRPPTSPTTVMGGFSLGISTANTDLRFQHVAQSAGVRFERPRVLHGISMLGWMAPVVLAVGGECRPSTWSDSAS